MTIAIVYTPDAVYLEPYILRLLQQYGTKYQFAVIRATNSSIISKKSSAQTLNYLLALVVILGLPVTFKNAFIKLSAKWKKQSDIERFCTENKIDHKSFTSANAKDCLAYLEQLKPELLFNQSNSILKSKVLGIPTIATFNRHGALLPKYKGRLAPFWQLKNGESEGGITYHIVNEKIDAGEIILQESFDLTSGYTVPKLINHMFDRAVALFPEAVERLQLWHQGEIQLTVNDAAKASYFSSPKLKDAWDYRFNRQHGKG